MVGEFKVTEMDKNEFNYYRREFISTNAHIISHDMVQQLEWGASWSVFDSLNKHKPKFSKEEKLKLLDVLYNSAIVHPNLDLPRQGVRRGNLIFHENLFSDEKTYFGNVLKHDVELESQLLTKGFWEALGLSVSNRGTHNFLETALSNENVGKLDVSIVGDKYFELNSIEGYGYDQANIVGLSESALDNYLIFVQQNPNFDAGDDLLVPYIDASLAIDDQTAFRYWYIFKEEHIQPEDKDKLIKEDYVQKLTKPYVVKSILLSEKLQNYLSDKVTVGLGLYGWDWGDPTEPLEKLSEHFPFLEDVKLYK